MNISQIISDLTRIQQEVGDVAVYIEQDTDIPRCDLCMDITLNPDMGTGRRFAVMRLKTWNTGYACSQISALDASACDTPRTEAAILCYANGVPAHFPAGVLTVSAEFARVLERELADCRAAQGNPSAAAAPAPIVSA